MYIRCWGSRGSMPVCGQEFIKYGGNTTCVEIRSKEGDLIIIDAGTGIKQLSNKLVKEKPKRIHFLFTHAHLDHLIGFPFFIPLFLRDSEISIHGPLLNRPSVESIFSDFLSRPFYPIQLEDPDIKAILSFEKFPINGLRVGPIRISSIPLSHPKDSGLGYRFEEDDKSFVFLTDNELGHVHKGGVEFNDYIEFCRDSNLLIHDAQYEQEEYRRILKISQEPWGHSVVDDVLQLSIKSNVRRLGLFHLDPSRTDENMDKLVRKSQEKIKEKNGNLECFGVSSEFEILL